MNKRFMKRYLLIAVLFCCVLAAQAQADTDTLRARAQAFLIKGDYDNALLVLNHAAEMDPDNKDILRDEAYIYYLQRNYAKAIETGQTNHQPPRCRCAELPGAGTCL